MHGTVGVNNHWPWWRSCVSGGGRSQMICSWKKVVVSPTRKALQHSDWFLARVSEFFVDETAYRTTTVFLLKSFTTKPDHLPEDLSLKPAVWITGAKRWTS